MRFGQKHHIITTVLFLWDPEKAERSTKKHGISFELAQTVFDDPLHLSILDAKAHGEERWVTIGRCANTNTLVVVHTYHVTIEGQESIRMISARKATRKESKQYEEGI